MHSAPLHIHSTVLLLKTYHYLTADLDIVTLLHTLQVANKAGMLHEMPDLLSNLRTMPGAPLEHTIVAVALDRAALQLCRQLHHPVLCVLDDRMTNADAGQIVPSVYTDSCDQVSIITNS